MSTREINGKSISFDEDGHMADAKEWNLEVANVLAKEEGIDSLTDKHMQVIQFMRDEYEKTGAVPTLRKITKASGVNTKEMYELYPKGPSKKAARIGGLPKPKGCI